MLAFIIRLIPKVGPFRTLAFRAPTPDTERFFMASFNATVTDYEHDLAEQKQSGHPGIINGNFDTGTVTAPLNTLSLTKLRLNWSTGLQKIISRRHS